MSGSSDSNSAGGASAKSSFSAITAKAPKYHQPVEVKAPGNKATAAVRKPEGWYDPETGRNIGFEPKEFKDLPKG